MAIDADLMIEAPSELEDWESPAVSLQEAAGRLGLTESEVLLRVIRGSLPSVLDGTGVRRVPLTALGAEEELPTGSREWPLISAHLEALEERLRIAADRICALEARESAPPEDDGRLEAMARELSAARARITALESSLEYPRPPWIRHWEACCRWLNLTT
jgi:hypothetical protein